jgi:hypothetical protein
MSVDLKGVPGLTSGSICRDISAILEINLAPVFLSKILRSISSKNSSYQARTHLCQFYGIIFKDYTKAQVILEAINKQI